MSKPNCYECIHRGEVPGSAHSSCRHPATQPVHADPLMRFAGLIGKRGGPQLMAMAPNAADDAARRLDIRANFHGIRNGWFVWPMNFDPTWLEQCTGFTP